LECEASKTKELRELFKDLKASGGENIADLDVGEVGYSIRTDKPEYQISWRPSKTQRQS